MALGPIGPRAYWPLGLLALGPIGPWAYWPWGLLAQGPGPKLFHLAECVAPWESTGHVSIDPYAKTPPRAAPRQLSRNLLGLAEVKNRQMKPSGTPNRGNRATRAPRAIGNTQGWARATCNFPDFCEFAKILFFKGVLGQSSLPIWLLGTIEFIWAGRIPLNPHHKIIPLQKCVFRDPKTKMSTSGVQNPTRPSKIHPWA